jgi:cysteine desulfurase
MTLWKQKSLDIKRNLYFDNNSYHLPNQKILKEIFDEGFFDLPLNPSSIHFLGQFASQILEEARELILGLLTLAPDFDQESDAGLIKRLIDKNRGSCSFFDLIFFGSSTESNNFVIENAFSNFECDLFLCSAAEHASVLEKILSLEKRKPKCSKILPVDEFSVIKEDSLMEILNANQDKKIFLSLIHANNETGSVNDLKSLIKKARMVHKNLLIHSDFSQAVGKISKINIAQMDLDFVNFCGHKFGGLAGCSPLIFKKKFILQPVLIGGGQESFLRSGTENLLSILVTKRILEEIYDSGTFSAHYKKLMNLRAYFEFGLAKMIIEIKCPDVLCDLKIFGSKILENLNFENLNLKDFENDALRPIPTSYFALKGISSKMAIIFLGSKGILVGSGSACSAGLESSSHVLSAMGFSKEFSDSAIRVSFCAQNSLKDVDFLLANLKFLFMKRG